MSVNEVRGVFTQEQVDKLDMISKDAQNKKKLEGQTLGQDGFLKILMTQMQYQNPMSPMDNDKFIGQMAQFSSVEQLTKLNTGMKSQNDKMDEAMHAMNSYMTGFANLYEGLLGKVDEDGKKLTNGTNDKLMAQNKEIISQNQEIIKVLNDIKTSLNAKKAGTVY